MHTPAETERQALDTAISRSAELAQSTESAVQIILLTVPPAPVRWLRDSNACSIGRLASDTWFQRAHGQNWSAPWFGGIAMVDQLGRKWERKFYAVVDDFGDLVEVQ